jgi:putative hemolysin
VVLVGALAAGALLFFALCELGPKMVFRIYPNRLCLGLALPFRLLHVLLKPIVGPMALLAGSWLKLSGGRRFTGSLFASREELRLLMQESGRGLSNEERAMINRVLELQKLKLTQVAVPMGKVAGVSVDAPVHEVLALARETGFSRFPVWWPGPARRTAGLVTVASLVFREEVDESLPVREFMKPALFLDGELRVEAALRQMQRTGNRLVMVLAPDRSEVGVVGWSDLLKAIFGEVSL